MVKRDRSEAIVYACRAAVAAAILFSAFSCDIFSPRLSETPEDLGRVDPLNFSAIMDSTGEKLTKLRYEDLFRDDIFYEDFNSGTYTKSQLIQRLQQIQIQDTKIHVQWKTGLIWKSAGSDTIKLSGLKYCIFPDSTTGVPADSGSSNFVVVRDRDWLISQWIDVPSRPAITGKSFFAP